MRWFELDAPIFAFSHCRDVVAAVCRAGGMGAMGTTQCSAEQLEIELSWLDEHTDGRPYAVDLMFASRAPERYEGMTRPEDVEHLLPREHRDFVEKLLRDHGVPELPPGESEQLFRDYMATMTRTHAQAKARLEVVLRHPLARMIVSALGVPPPEVIDEAHSRDMRVAALVGHPRHVDAHKRAGVDLLVSQGTEAGGHTGDVASFVLTPQVVEAAAPLPVLHAGGIGRGRQIAAALALGAQGVWCGSIWLTTSEAETSQAVRRKIIDADSGGTVRSRDGTGKPARRLRSAWTDAWNDPTTPDPLPMPLQTMLVNEARVRIARYEPPELLTYPAGQVVGMIDRQPTVRQVMYDLLAELGETMERLEHLYAADDEAGPHPAEESSSGDHAENPTTG